MFLVLFTDFAPTLYCFGAGDKEVEDLEKKPWKMLKLRINTVVSSDFQNADAIYEGECICILPSPSPSYPQSSSCSNGIHLSLTRYRVYPRQVHLSLCRRIFYGTVQPLCS